MSRMFYGAAAMNSDIRRWDTDNVTNMASMFAYAISFNQDISHWLVDAVVNMEGMFRNASSLIKTSAAGTLGPMTRQTSTPCSGIRDFPRPT